jgi:GH24 family phage-related lysozyme (muramidase)
LEKLPITLTDNEFSAVASFIFNLGIGYFMDSTLYKLLKETPRVLTIIKIENTTGNVTAYLKQDNLKELDNIDYNFRRHCNASGKASKGLYNRRKAEFNLFNTI